MQQCSILFALQIVVDRFASKMLRLIFQAPHPRPTLLRSFIVGRMASLGSFEHLLSVLFKIPGKEVNLIEQPIFESVNS
jgi:hypothetical protein